MTAKICKCDLDGVCIYQLFTLGMSRESFALHQIGNWITTTLHPKPQAQLIYKFQSPHRWASKVHDVKLGAYPISLSCLFIDTSTRFLQSIENGRKSTYTWMNYNFSDETQIYQSGIPGPYLDYFFWSAVIGPVTGRWWHGEKELKELIKQKESTSAVQNLGEELATKVFMYW